MQAITTKYLPATNTKGARIKATCEAGSVTISYPHEATGESAHRIAMRTLVAKFPEVLRSAHVRERGGTDRWAYAELAPGTYAYVPSFYGGIYQDFPEYMGA